MIRTDDFDFFLPPELIAQEPFSPRDRCRMLVLDRKKQTLEHKTFSDIVDYLVPGDCLVLNDTRVLPARFLGIKEGTGGKVEILFVSKKEGEWECLLNHSRRVKRGTIIRLPEQPDINWEILDRDSETWLLHPSFPEEREEEIFYRYGKTPTPPYIKKRDVKPDDYQTVYAIHDGSVAAPTAGLHFTPGLLDGICQRGIQVTTLTLHVGMGTFLPVKSPYLEGHIMHTERFVIGALSAQLIREAKKKGQRIIAVGTTVVRVLETLRQRWGEVREGEGTTDIFISPGFQFQVIDALITNFHVPRSTLFMLVCAFGTTEFLKKAYWEAVQERYRFYSFGDATFIY